MGRNDPEWGKFRQAGFTLVELMVSLLIVGVVMLGWWRIMNATSPYREAQRRAAVEVAAGMLDIFPPETVNTVATYPKRYRVNPDGSFTEDLLNVRHALPSEWFPSESPIRYTLGLKLGTGNEQWNNWHWDPGFMEWQKQSLARTVWLVVELFDGEDTASHPTPFASLKQIVSSSRY